MGEAEEVGEDGRFSFEDCFVDLMEKSMSVGFNIY